MSVIVDLLIYFIKYLLIVCLLQFDSNYNPFFWPIRTRYFAFLKFCTALCGLPVEFRRYTICRHSSKHYCSLVDYHSCLKNYCADSVGSQTRGRYIYENCCPICSTICLQLTVYNVCIFKEVVSHKHFNYVYS